MVTISPNGFTLPALNLKLPSDPSSAAFLVVAGLLVPDSEIEVSDLCLNPGRTGLLDVIQFHESGHKGLNRIGPQWRTDRDVTRQVFCFEGRHGRRCLGNQND